MSSHSRKPNIPFAVVVPMAAGSDPEVMEIDDDREVYGDWPEIDTPCDDPENPGDQCVYNSVSLEPTRCLYCRKLTG